MQTIVTATTPTLTLTMPEDVDLSNAERVVVTFCQNGVAVLEKNEDELTIDNNRVSVFLTQEDTLKLYSGAAHIRMNWTFYDGDVLKRAATKVVQINIEKNCHNSVLE